MNFAKISKLCFLTVGAYCLFISSAMAQSVFEPAYVRIKGNIKYEDKGVNSAAILMELAEINGGQQGGCPASSIVSSTSRDGHFYIEQHVDCTGAIGSVGNSSVNLSVSNDNGDVLASQYMMLGDIFTEQQIFDSCEPSNNPDWFWDCNFDFGELEIEKNDEVVEHAILVHGKVISQNQSPINNAIVRLYDHNNEFLGITTTFRDGEYSFVAGTQGSWGAGFEFRVEALYSGNTSDETFYFTQDGVYEQNIQIDTAMKYLGTHRDTH